MCCKLLYNQMNELRTFVEWIYKTTLLYKTHAEQPRIVAWQARRLFISSYNGVECAVTAVCACVAVSGKTALQT